MQHDSCLAVFQYLKKNNPHGPVRKKKTQHFEELSLAPYKKKQFKKVTRPFVSTKKGNTDVLNTKEYPSIYYVKSVMLFVGDNRKLDE